MIVRVLILFLLGAGGVLANTPTASSSCAAIVEPLPRLKCYDSEKNENASGPISAKKIFLEILESPAAVAAIFASLLALISGISGPLVQMTIGGRQAAAALQSADAAMLTARNAGNREIARMRLLWMDKLREVLSEYHAILMIVDDGDMSNQAQKLAQLGTQIDLLLNRDDRAQCQLWEVADKIYNSENAKERQSYDEELIKAGRNVFKSEWEKIKNEMRGDASHDRV